jgi:type VI secretion system protein ImpE
VTANELFEAGQLQEAVDAQIQKIKGRPADQAARLFLVELLLFQGEDDRAKKHLEMLQYDAPQAQAGLELIKACFAAAQERREVLAGRAQPMGLKESPEHVRLRLQALEQFSQGHAEEANQLLDLANVAMPGAAGTVDGQAVAACRDGDDLFGSVLEVFSRGKYCWVPLEQIEKLTIAPAKSPRDVLYVPAHLALHGGLEGDVHLPGIYPESQGSDDPDIRLGRATDWQGGEGRPIRGIGGKTWLLENSTKPLLHIREWAAAATT